MEAAFRLRESAQRRGGEGEIDMRVRGLSVLLCLLILVTATSASESWLIRVERQAPGDLARLQKLGVGIVHETRPVLFALGDAASLAALRDAGYEASVLDRQAAQSDYLQVGTRPDSLMPAVRAFGTELAHEENWRLIRVPHGAPLDALAPARVFVTRLPRAPLPPRSAAPPTLETLGRAGADPLVQQIVDGVAVTHIQTYWQDLTANPPTRTRQSKTAGCRDAAEYCLNAFTAANVSGEYQSYSSSHAPNVIGTHTGAITPERVYIVIGHLDDLPFWGTAPGANDNASGSVTVLEAARATSCYAFRSTIKYLAVTGEEWGLYGSDAYAADAQARGEDIRAVLNFDMNGWEGDGLPASGENLDLNYNDDSAALAQAYVENAADYNTGLAVDAFYCPSLTASDHYSFWKRGYTALCGITDNEGY